MARRNNKKRKTEPHAGKVNQVDLKKLVVTVDNPQFKKPAKKRRQRKPKFVPRDIEVTTVERSLERSGVDSKSAHDLATGTYYDGLPMSNVSIPGVVQDLVYNAQICALHIIARYPELLFDPSATLESKSIAPTQIVAYLVVCGLCHLRKLGLLTGENAAAYSTVFNEEYSVPVGFAKYLEYACRFEGPPRMQTVFNLTADFTMTLQEVTAPTGSLNYDLSQLQIFDGYQTNNAVMFPVKSGAGDSTIFAGPYTVPYTGLSTGSNPFIGSNFMETFSRVIQQEDRITTVEFGKIAQWAPDASAWGAAYGDNAADSNWMEYSGVLYASRKHDVDMTMLLRPNFDFSQSEIMPFPLGHQETVPQPSAPNFVSNTTQFVSSGTNVTQQMDWFYWNGARNKYTPGKWRGRNGWRTKCGEHLCRYFQVVNREVDTYGLTKQALVGLSQWVEAGLSGKANLTDDYIDLFTQAFETLLLAKVFETGNWSLQGGIGVNVTLSVQQLLPYLSVSGVQVPLFVKAIIDSVGVGSGDGALYLPQVTVNAYGTLATNGGGIAWQNWPKFGSVLETGGPANNRYISATVDDIAFPFVPMSPPVANAAGAQPVPSGANVIGGGGALDATQGTWLGAVVINSLTALTNAKALPNVGSFNPNYVMWQLKMASIMEFVMSYFGSLQNDSRGVTGILNDDRLYGGPGMFAIQIMAPRQIANMQRYAIPHFSVNANAYVAPQFAAVFSAYLPIKYNYFVPLSPVDHGLAISFPICSIYKLNATPYTMATAFAEIPLSSLGNTATDAATAKLNEIDGEIVSSYIKEAERNHQGKKSILSKTPYRISSDCLRKGLMSFGERASDQFAKTDWLKVTKNSCRAGVSFVGAGYLRPVCSLVPYIYKMYKSVRDNYDGKAKGGNSPLLMAASH